MEEGLFQTRDGTKIFLQYWNGGHDKTIIYVHGGPGQGCWDFKYAAQLLSHRCNVLAFDQRGVLRSDAVGDGFCSEELIDDIEDIRKSYRCYML